MLDFKKIEEEVLKFWEKNKIYEKSKSWNHRTHRTAGQAS